MRAKLFRTEESTSSKSAPATKIPPPVAVRLQPKPPKLSLEYDLKEKLLTIKGKHVSKDNRDHYIRRIYIYLNEAEKPVETLKFSYQKSTKGIEELVDIVAQEDDILLVKALCAEGGKAEETLIVEAIVDNEEELGNPEADEFKEEPHE